MLKETDLRKVVQQLPTLEWSTEQQKAVDHSEYLFNLSKSNQEVLAPLLKAGFLKRPQELTHAARRLAKQGEAEALALSLSWLDTLFPNWLLLPSQEEQVATLLANCAGGSQRTLEYILKYGIDPHLQMNGSTALRAAVSSQIPENVKILLALNIQNTTAEEPDLFPLIHLAALGGNIEVLMLLLQAGYNVNQLDSSSRPKTALTNVILQTQNREIITTLLEAGADINIPYQSEDYTLTALSALFLMKEGIYSNLASWALAEIDRVSLDQKTKKTGHTEKRPDRL